MENRLLDFHYSNLEFACGASLQKVITILSPCECLLSLFTEHTILPFFLWLPPTNLAHPCPPQPTCLTLALLYIWLSFPSLFPILLSPSLSSPIPTTPLLALSLLPTPPLLAPPLHSHPLLALSLHSHPLLALPLHSHPYLLPPFPLLLSP